MKPAISASPVRTLVKATIGIAVTAAIIFIAMSLPSGMGHEWYHATYEHKTEFVGTKGKDGRIEYFSVRVGGDNAQAISTECELEFHWQGQKYRVSELELNDLTKMGISAKSNTRLPDGVMTACIGGKDDSHQDYGVEFYFRNGQIYHFYARHSAHNKVACPFMISIPQQQPVSFPLVDEQLRSTFGVPVSVVAVPGT